MNNQEFLAEWSNKYPHLDMSAGEVAKSFSMSSSEASAMLKSFVESGKCTSHLYTGSRVTIYTLA